MKITLNPWRRAKELRRRNDDLTLANQTLVTQLHDRTDEARTLRVANIRLKQKNDDLQQRLTIALEAVRDGTSVQ